MKRTKPQQRAYDEILAHGGIVKSSDWTTGRGRYITCRAVPPGCQRFERFRSVILGEAPENVKAFFEAHPKVQVVIAVVDTEAAHA